MADCPPLLVVDGNSLCYVAHHGGSVHLHKDGYPIQAVAGFLSLLCQFLEQHPTHFPVILWDCEDSNWRTAISVDYKAQRSETLEQREVRGQVKSQRLLIKEYLEFCDVIQVSRKNHEADDLAYEMCSLPHFKEIALLTADSDWLQLLKPGVFWKNCRKPYNQITDGPDFLKNTGNATPLEYIEAKVIRGDTADNIAGLSGIGPVRAKELLSRFGGLARLLEQWDSMKDFKESHFTRLAQDPAQKSILSLNKQLMILGQRRPQSSEVLSVSRGSLCDFSLCCALDDLGLAYLARNISRLIGPLTRPAFEKEAVLSVLLLHANAALTEVPSSI